MVQNGTKTIWNSFLTLSRVPSKTQKLRKITMNLYKSQNQSSKEWWKSTKLKKLKSLQKIINNWVLKWAKIKLMTILKISSIIRKKLSDKTTKKQKSSWETLINVVLLKALSWAEEIHTRAITVDPCLQLSLRGVWKPQRVSNRFTIRQMSCSMILIR